MYMDERWVPLLDYAVANDISTSTLRRYIKANKIQYKVENGRYLILSQAKSNQTTLSDSSTSWEEDPKEIERLRAKNQELTKLLMLAQEQTNELKMLVAIYEEQLAMKSKES